MIILQITPSAASQNFWVALIEAILILALAAYIGWWIARRTFALQIEGLQGNIRARRLDLNDCKKTIVIAEPSAAIPMMKSVAMPVVADDLKLIEGIGPKIEELLNKEGILTFAQLASTASDHIKEILNAAGPRFQMHDPTTWPEQSALARDGKWDDLKTWQDELNKGRLE